MGGRLIAIQEKAHLQDLEIYIRDLAPGQLSTWLANHLDQLALDDSDPAAASIKGAGFYGEYRVGISVYAGAFGKRYSCLVLEGEDLPWNSDLECARSAWRSLETEIRCSQSEWQEGDPVEDEKWWRLDDRGEQLAVWN
jgi:hypothetical protein